jgi:hypothetical protein
MWDDVHSIHYEENSDRPLIFSLFDRRHVHVTRRTNE